MNHLTNKILDARQGVNLLYYKSLAFSERQLTYNSLWSDAYEI